MTSNLISKPKVNIKYIMTDSKDKKEIKKEEALADGEEGLTTEKSASKTADKPEQAAAGEKEEKGIKGLEELPEEIVKKMEKKKAESKKLQSKKKVVRKKKKTARRVTVGKAYIKATYNNTMVTLTDIQGNVLSWASAGVAGFKGPKKSTPYAAQIITRIAVGKAREDYGLSEVSVFVKGVGTGRESAVRALNNNGLIITSIKDMTPIPHNGCRPPKPRRV